MKGGGGGFTTNAAAVGPRGGLVLVGGRAGPAGPSLLTHHTPLVFPRIVEYLGVLRNLLRDGLNVIQLLDHVVVNQLLVDIRLFDAVVVIFVKGGPVGSGPSFSSHASPARLMGHLTGEDDGYL